MFSSRAITFNSGCRSWTTSKLSHWKLWTHESARCFHHYQMVNGEPRHCGDGGEWTSTNLEQSRPMLAPPSLAESEILVVNWEWINLVVKLVVAIFLWILNLMALIFWFFEVFDPFRGAAELYLFRAKLGDRCEKMCAADDFTRSAFRVDSCLLVDSCGFHFRAFTAPTIKSWEHDHHWILYHLFSKPALNFSPSKLRCFSVKTAASNIFFA